jgi:hypothetical protein
MDQVGQGTQTARSHPQPSRHNGRGGRSRFGIAERNQLVMTTRGLNHQLRFALLPHRPDDRNKLSTERMVGSNDANTLEVTGT